MSSVKKAVFTSVCMALCYVLPLAFHAIGLGAMFAPLHIPVLLCGLLCGWPYGLFCGIAGPVISSLLGSMPTAPQLIYMVPELAAYGLFAGLLFHLIHTGHLLPDLYLALVPAMLLGRVIGGLAQAIFYLSTARSYTLALWAGSYFASALPGILTHLVVIPALVSVLMQAGLIPRRDSTKRS